jgi:hypothetical protein
MKSINPWRKKLKVLDDGKPSHVHGSAELVLWKWLYCQKQAIDSAQSPSKFQYHFS